MADRWVTWKAEDRRRPPGAWRQFQMADRVIGMRHRRMDAVTFLNGMVSAEEAKQDWGIELEREPENPRDPNAIKVIGRWTETKKRWFRAPETAVRRLHIGYVDGDMAAALAEFGPSLPIAAEVYEVTRLKDFDLSGDGLPLVIKIIVLVPSKKDPVWKEISCER